MDWMGASEAINNSVGYYMWTKFWIGTLTTIGIVALIIGLLLGGLLFLGYILDDKTPPKELK